jgi:hypothetical protein
LKYKGLRHGHVGKLPKLRQYKLFCTASPKICDFLFSRLSCNVTVSRRKFGKDSIIVPVDELQDQRSGRADSWIYPCGCHRYRDTQLPSTKDERGAASGRADERVRRTGADAGGAMLFSSAIEGF